MPTDNNPINPVSKTNDPQSQAFSPSIPPSDTSLEAANFTAGSAVQDQSVNTQPDSQFQPGQFAQTSTPFPQNSDTQPNQPGQGGIVPEMTINTTVPPHTPKKYGGPKVIATIFGLVVLVGAVVLGVGVLQKQQLQVNQAWDCSTYVFSVSQYGAVSVINGSTRNEPAQQAKVYINNSLVNTFSVPYLPRGSSANLGQVTVPTSSGFTWRVDGTVDCEDSGSYPPQNSPTPSPEPTLTPTLPPATATLTPTLPPATSTVTPTDEPTSTPTLTPTLPPEITAECQDVVAYDQDWNVLSLQNLSQLSEGDIVYFAVSGNSSSGVFEKARFSVNGVLRSEVTTQKPGSEEFYDEYTIPSGITTFNIGAQIYHSELGWI